MNSLEHGVLKIVLELEQFVNTKNSTLTTPLSGGGDGERRRRNDMAYTLQQENQILGLIKWRRKALQEEREALKKSKQLTDRQAKQIEIELEDLRFLEMKNREARL